MNNWSTSFSHSYHRSSALILQSDLLVKTLYNCSCFKWKSISCLMVRRACFHVFFLVFFHGSSVFSMVFDSPGFYPPVTVLENPIGTSFGGRSARRTRCPWHGARRSRQLPGPHGLGIQAFYGGNPRVGPLNHPVFFCDFPAFLSPIWGIPQKWTARTSLRCRICHMKSKSNP